MKTALNIGIENNPRSVEEIVTALKVLVDYELLHRIDESEYLGKPERTLVVLLEHPNELGLVTLIERLAVALEQECIACYFYDWSRGSLLYDPFHRGPVQAFDMKYFIEY